MKAHRFAHDYSASEAEIVKATETFAAKSQRRKRMLSTRPPVPDDLPEGVELPNDRAGCLAVFLRKKG